MIDGSNLIPHPLKPRMLESTDEQEIADLRIDPATVNIETVYNALLLAQGTALNLSGYQRTFIQTEKTIIAVDPRFEVPRTFAAFSFMMFRFSKENLVKGEGGERLMYPVKKDVSKWLPPGVSVFSAVVKEEGGEKKAFQWPAVVYVNVDTTKGGENQTCLSRDILGCSAVIARVVGEAETARGGFCGGTTC